MLEKLSKLSGGELAWSEEATLCASGFGASPSPILNRPLPAQSASRAVGAAATGNF